MQLDDLKKLFEPQIQLARAKGLPINETLKLFYVMDLGPGVHIQSITLQELVGFAPSVRISPQAVNGFAPTTQVPMPRLEPSV